MLQTVETRLFGGRTSRAGFWGALLVMLVSFLVGAAVFAGTADPKDIAASARRTTIPSLIAVAGLVIFLRAAGRRLHDLGQSGLWALAAVPFVDILGRIDAGAQTLTLTLSPVIALLYPLFGTTDWAAPIEWLRDTFSLRLGFASANVKLTGLIFPIIAGLGLIPGSAGANAFGAPDAAVAPK